MAEPEPIPDVFRSPGALAEREEGRKSRKGLWIVLILLIALGALGAGLYYTRNMVVNLWEGASEVYAWVGIDAEPVGAGLQLSNVRSDWLTDGGERRLVVSGEIANVSDKVRPVPMVRIEFRDADGEVVQTYVYPPDATELEPGGQLSFKAHVGEVVLMARRVDVQFTNELPEDMTDAGGG